jgi:hypothetical protein
VMSHGQSISEWLMRTRKTAWFMMHRIRFAQHSGSISKMTGVVEADETLVCGAVRFIHADKRAEKIHGRGPEGKAIVFGLLDRAASIICIARFASM